MSMIEKTTNTDVLAASVGILIESRRLIERTDASNPTEVSEAISIIHEYLGVVGGSLLHLADELGCGPEVEHQIVAIHNKETIIAGRGMSVEVDVLAVNGAILMSHREVLGLVKAIPDRPAYGMQVVVIMHEALRGVERDLTTMADYLGIGEEVANMVHENLNRVSALRACSGIKGRA